MNLTRVPPHLLPTLTEVVDPADRVDLRDVPVLSDVVEVEAVKGSAREASSTAQTVGPEPLQLEAAEPMSALPSQVAIEPATHPMDEDHGSGGDAGAWDPQTEGIHEDFLAHGVEAGGEGGAVVLDHPGIEEGGLETGRASVPPAWSFPQGVDAAPTTTSEPYEVSTSVPALDESPPSSGQSESPLPPLLQASMAAPFEPPSRPAPSPQEVASQDSSSQVSSAQDGASADADGWWDPSPAVLSPTPSWAQPSPFAAAVAQLDAVQTQASATAGEALQPVGAGPQPVEPAAPAVVATVSSEAAPAAVFGQRPVDRPAESSAHTPVVSAAAGLSMQEAEEITRIVLDDLSRHLDPLLQQRVGEMLSPLVARWSETLVRELGGELAAVLHEVVHRAVVQEMDRRSGR